MAAMARYAGVSLVDFWIDDRGPWNDVVGVFSHTPFALAPSSTEIEAPSNCYMEEVAAASIRKHAAPPEMEVISGKPHYLKILEQLHAVLEPRFYLEIGVDRGRSLALANCPAVGVDPLPDATLALLQKHRLYAKTSDAFFDTDAPGVLAGQMLELVFIDGMHLFEFGLRDFINVERYASPATVVVIDDIYPNHPVQAERKRQSTIWTGDMWKLHKCLESTRPELLLVPIDAAPTGLLLVVGLNASNRKLLESYNTLVERYKDMNLGEYAAQVLQREGARSADDPLVWQVLAELKSESDQVPQRNCVERLRNILGR